MTNHLVTTTFLLEYGNSMVIVWRNGSGKHFNSEDSRNILQYVRQYTTSPVELSQIQLWLNQLNNRHAGIE